MANNRQIETLGVSYLATFINRNRLLQTYFDNNDKTPAWDGEIHVLKNASERKSEIFGKVPVQIKATKQKNNSIKSFPVDMRDLELYSKNGGVVKLRSILKTSVYPEIANELLKEEGLLKSDTKVITDKFLASQIITADTEIAFSKETISQSGSKSKVVNIKNMLDNATKY